MADVNNFERCFVEIFIRKEKQDRYLTFLKGPKHRQKILEQLNHSLDYEPSLAKQLPPAARDKQYLTEYLQSLFVADTFHFMADGNELDGQNLRLELAVTEFLDNCWGALLICPPKPIVIYKEEDIGQLLILSEPSGRKRIHC